MTIVDCFVFQHSVYLGVDPSIGTAGVSEGDNTSQFTDPISIRTDEGTSAVSITGCVALTAGTHHVLSDVAGEDRLAVSRRVQRDLDPLQMVGQEQTWHDGAVDGDHGYFFIKSPKEGPT